MKPSLVNGVLTFEAAHKIAEENVKKNPDFCPYCGCEHFEQDDYEFGTEAAWIRYACVQCHCEWAAVFKLEYGEVSEHTLNNQEAWGNYQEKLRFL